MIAARHLSSPSVSRSITPVAASTIHPAVARTAARRARLSAAGSTARRRAAARARCSAQPARLAGRKLGCRSSPPGTGPSTARSAIRTIAHRHLEAARVGAVAIDGMPARGAAGIGTGERMTVTEGGSTTRCRQCRKPIIWPGLCYTCATGLPRQLRPRQDNADESPGHPVTTGDETGGHR